MKVPPVVRPLAWLVSLVLMGAVVACTSGAGRAAPGAGRTAAAPVPERAVATGHVLPGIDTLAARGFAELQGKRVGLLTHPAGVNRAGTPTIDVLRQAPTVQLVALFACEHGLYGDKAADAAIADGQDPRTGLPVHSLYGRTRRPTAAMLRGIDALVIDLQDIGTRSYTFISAMRFAMEGAFQHNVEVIVLDRPNPLGGLKVDGPLLEERWMSYVGAFRVPYVHGLTIGELAIMAKELPGWMPAVTREVQERGRLTVIPMTNWSRRMMWPDTGLRFVGTSPFIQDLSAVLGYPMTGLGAQLGGFRHGIGSAHPFRLLGYAGKSPEEVRDTLAARGIPGVAFEVITVQGRRGPERGVFIRVTDWSAVRPTELSFHMMQLAAAWSPRGNPFAAATPAQAELFNKHVGSTTWWDALVRDGARVDVDGFVRRWEEQARVFQRQSQRYWLYR